MATATAALVVFIALNVRLSVTDPLTGAFGVVATALVVVVALALGDSGRRARIGVVVAATTSGVFILSLSLWISVIVRPLSVASPLQHALLGATTVLVVAAWGGLWYALFSSQALARDRFLDAGREITTAQAAVSAYLMITIAGCFLATTLGSLAVAWRLLRRAPGSIWLLAAGLALPAAYLVAGSLYQLGQLAAMVWQIRTRSDQQPDLNDLDLPFEPTQPVWILDEETFYAGAYWDPFDHAIVVSSGAVETLDARELAVIVAHEESHFKYQGAHRQFAFAVLPAFALMGKNVVYSIYDFRERELTADAYALQRLEDAVDDDAPEVVVSVLQRFLRNEFDELEGSVLTFLPTLQTTAAAQGAKRALDVVFEAFYGHYAGNVHPSNDERIRAIRARAKAESELSPTERPNGDGDTGPVDRQDDDADTSPSDRPDADAD
jgi:Zn-dependent protease with chaperone function